MLDIIGITKNGTPIYNHPALHPHRLDEVAIAAIAKMIVPTEPADPTDRSQTRVAQTVDLGYKIGINHRIKRTPDMRCFKMRRADNKGRLRGWFSIMTLDGELRPETKLTSVVIWDSENTCWVLLTNHEGEEDPYPEPGTDRFNRLPAEEQGKAKKWHEENILKCTTKEELQCLRTVTYKC